MPPKKGSGAAVTQGKDEQKKKPSKMLDDLQKEIESLKLHVAQLEENFDYKKICTKLNIREENMLAMMQDENAKQRARIYELESSQISSDIKEDADNNSDDLKKLEEQLLKKDKDMHELQEKLDIKIDEFNKKEQELQKNLDAKIDELKEELDKKKKELQSTQTTLSTEIEDLKEQLKGKDEELRQLETKAESLKNENEHLKTQLHEAHNTIANQKTDLSSRDVNQIPKEECGETTGGNESEKHTKLEENYETLRKKKDDFEQKLKAANDIIADLKTKQPSRDVEQTTKEAAEETTDRSKREIDKLQEELQTTKNELDEKKAMIAETVSKLHTLEQNLKATETEKQNNKISIDDLKYELQTAKSEVEKLKRQQENQRDVNNIQNHDLKLKDEHEIAENKKEIAKLKDDLSASESKVKDLEKQIKINETKCSDQMTEERKSLENEFKEKDKEINELRKSLSKSESEVKSLKDKISKLESTRARSASRPRNDELKKAHEEIEELKTRLSKVMGDKITENNPDIADLSDLNRPTKLAERYSELYDNEWTDAFEELENNRMESRQILDELYNILKDVYIFSQKVSYDYDKSVRSSAIRIPGGSEERPKTPNMNSSTRKQLVDLKKTFAPLLASDVFKLYLKKYKEAIGPKTKKFIGVCTEICWLMSVQDPPVVLDIEEPNGRFDKDKYKFYQRSGKQVDFIVWPPMRLHEKGPLLGKGVAEGK